MKLNRKTYTALGIIVLMIVVITLIQWLKPEQNQSTSSETSAQQAQNAALSPEEAARQQTQGNNPLASASQQDIEINCQLQMDPSNRLIVNENTKNCFEFFITQYGEKDIQQIKSDFIRYAEQSYKDPLLGQLTDLWQRYFQYREKLGDLQPPSANKDSAQYYKAIFAQMKSLRKQFFSDYEIEGLFGIADQYDDYTLARMSVLEDNALSETAKAEKLQQLFNELPQDWQDNLKQLNQLEDLRHLTTEIKARGGSAAEIRQMRLNLVGPEATQRLENLDQKQTDWKNRVTQYLSERENISQSGMNPVAKNTAIQQLRSKHFNTPQEQLRVETFEQVHDQGGKLPFAE